MSSKLEILLEAARRANWDALHGPRHLRAGRFRPTVAPVRGDAEHAAREGVETGGASHRR